MFNANVAYHLRDHGAAAVFASDFDVVEFGHIKKLSQLSQTFSVYDRITRISHSYLV